MDGKTGRHTERGVQGGKKEEEEEEEKEEGNGFIKDCMGRGGCEPSATRPCIHQF